MWQKPRDFADEPAEVLETCDAATVVRFQAINFWPATGHRDRPWDDEPEVDAWLKSARRVEELYSEALRSVDLTGPVSTLRLHSFPADDGAATIRAEVWVDRPDGWEFCGVSVPPAVAALPAGARGRLVFGVIDAALAELAPGRGWPPEVLAEAREYARARDLRFIWSSPWKTSPSRALQARSYFQLADDGYGRVVIEIRDRRTEALVARSPEAVAYSTLAGFKRTARTLRWVDGAVELVPYIDILGRRGAQLQLGPNDGVAPLVLVDDGESAAGELTVAVEVVQTGEPSGSPSIVVVGGGPTNGVPDAYLDELDACLLTIKDSHLAWWSGADRPHLEIWYEFGDAPEVPVTRRTKDKLIAHIHRDPKTLRAASDHVRLARADAIALLNAVGDKMRLGPPPDLRS